MVDLYDNEFINECRDKSIIWNDRYGIYYQSFLCCKNISKRASRSTILNAFNNISPFIENNQEDIFNNIQDDKCVLIKNHQGNCSKHVSFLNKKEKEKINLSIYSTPGNDEYIYKNRTDRLFPIMLSSFHERNIKDKEQKLKCAIPLKDASTPLMLVGAYFDYITFLVNIKDAKYNIEPEYNLLLMSHKKKLIEHFNIFNRKIFNQLGYTICPVTGREIKLKDFLSGDVRYNPPPTSIQLGHCETRNDYEFTVRGFNICMMTRKGNSIIGDLSFFENEWLDYLKLIIDFQNDNYNIPEFKLLRINAE